MKSNNIELVNDLIDFIGSPFFYCNKGQYIFKVELTDGEVWWVRTGVFSNDYEKNK